MDPVYISALAALGGSAVGALASFTTTWLTLNVQERANRSARAVARRESLYGDFIEEASKAFTDALVHKLDDASKLVHLYALASKLRLFASADVLSKMDEVLWRILEIYESDEKGFPVSITPQERQMDILRAFSEACRTDLNL